MRRLSWRLRALYDDEFGRRVDRWFGAGAAVGLLIIALKPVVLGAPPGAPPIGIFSMIAAIYFLLGAFFWPRMVTPFSLLCIAFAGAFVRLMPGVDRAEDIEPGDLDPIDIVHRSKDDGA
jgi:hypothetical protein